MTNVANPYMLYPFASQGDTALIPNTGTDNTSVNYQYGWTIPYQLPLNTNPSALPIPRTQMNQLMLDITTAIQQFQLQGAPLWVSPSAGGPEAYNLWSMVIYTDGNLYQSQVADNVSIPGADSNWIVISGSTQGVPVGTIIDYAGTSLNNGYLACDGSAYSRTTYALLLSALTSQQNVTLTNTLNTFTVSSSFGLYVGMDVEGAGIQAGATISIISGTTITMSLPATASGNVPVKFFNWGNGDGSTTFNVPNLASYVTAGQGGSNLLPTVGSTIGQQGGSSTHAQIESELAPHSHPGSTVNLGTGTNIADTTLSGPLLVQKGGSFSSALTIASDGAGTPFTIVQPTAIVYKQIKYI